LAELFAKEGNQDSNSLKALRIYFARDFGGYVANKAARAGKNCSVNAEDKVPCSST
jgi:hypothetical protein